MTKEERATERKNDRKILNEAYRIKREIARETKNMTDEELLAYCREAGEWAAAKYGCKLIHHVSEA
ncbi:hypothetical protein FACS1894200_11530 [Spirochaetia bacterium]|nr:hypothetical protein FACS1894200_11530 [Spirochaetia bacterium]